MFRSTQIKLIKGGILWPLRVFNRGLNGRFNSLVVAVVERLLAVVIALAPVQH
jgi:hypothetical protein